jgi:hypothetical protein
MKKMLKVDITNVGIYGDTSGIKGGVTGIIGDVSNISGHITGTIGNITTDTCNNHQYQW